MINASVPIELYYDVQVDSVTVACCKFMATHLHPSNCIGVRNFAEQHGHAELVAQADQFIIDNFLAVASSEEFRCMTPENLMTILTSSLLNIRSEVCDNITLKIIIIITLATCEKLLSYFNVCR